MFFFYFRHRTGAMFAHAKFVNSPNVPGIDEIPPRERSDNTYEQIDGKAATSRTKPADDVRSDDDDVGMINPMYDALKSGDLGTDNRTESLS